MSHSSFFQLEPRLLFDASVGDAAEHTVNDGAVAAEFSGLAYVQDDAQAHADDQAGEDHVYKEGHDTGPAEGQDSLLKSPSLLDLADNAQDHEVLLHQAGDLVRDKLVEWFNSDAFRSQAAEIFEADAGSASWEAQLESLRNDVLSGAYIIRTEVRSNQELMQVLGAWTANGTTGERTI